MSSPNANQARDIASRDKHTGLEPKANMVSIQRIRGLSLKSAPFQPPPRKRFRAGETHGATFLPIVSDRHIIESKSVIRC